jgi:hypothetical protein
MIIGKILLVKVVYIHTKIIAYDKIMKIISGAGLSLG